MEKISKSLAETEAIAQEFLAGLVPSEKGATVVGLRGNLGSGKTTFVQVIGRLLGVTTPIQSPTFVLIKSYKLQTPNYKLLYHIDAYRLEDGEDLLKLRFGELLNNPTNLIFIEWPEKVTSALPENLMTLDFEFVDERTRKIILPLK